MNLSQLRNLKTKDLIKYTGPAFTQEKIYQVIKTEVGRKILDDNGIYRFLLTREIDFTIVSSDSEPSPETPKDQ